MRVLTDRPSDLKIREGDVLTATAITAANIIKDIREHITNTFGGEMSRYEELVDLTVERALERLREKAHAGGYDGVCGLRIANPSVVDGGVEVIVYGTGFHIVHDGGASNPQTGDESATS